MAELTLPETGQFFTLSEYRQAMDRLMQAARRRICLFDQDLADAGLEAPDRAEGLRRFLLAGRDHRLQIVVHDARPLQCCQPRLLALLRQFSHALEIRQTGEEARGLSDTLMVVDETHYLRRFHFDQPRGQWALHDRARAQVLQRRFEEIWLASTTAVTATTLGL